MRIQLFWLLLSFVTHSTVAFLSHSPGCSLAAQRYNTGNLNRDDPQCVQFWRKAGSPSAFRNKEFLPKLVQTQRKSVASIQTFGLFGLGVGEIAIILAVLAAVLGPENIGRLIKSSGSKAQEFSQELKKVPDEFQKGMEEGESDARARNAKPVKIIVNKNGTPKDE